MKGTGDRGYPTDLAVFGLRLVDANDLNRVFFTFVGLLCNGRAEEDLSQAFLFGLIDDLGVI